MEACDTCGVIYDMSELSIVDNRQVCDSCQPTKVQKVEPSQVDNSIPAPPEIHSQDTPSKLVDFTPLLAQQMLTKRLGDFINAKHQDFFNQEVQDLREMTIEQIKERIEQNAEAYFGAEAEAIRRKVKLQAAGSVFNDKNIKTTSLERERMRVEDKNYKPRLVSPLKVDKVRREAAKKARTKESLEKQVGNLFGENAEEALRKLGLL